MEQTLLEKLLEMRLPSIGMQLGPRVYADDKDFAAQIEDSVTKVKSDAPGIVKFFAAIRGDISMDQLSKGDHNFISRYSSVHKGLGVKYDLAAPDSSEDCRTRADYVVKNKSFDDEAICIEYNADVVWKDLTLKRGYNSAISKFHRGFNNILSIAMYTDGIIAASMVTSEASSEHPALMLMTLEKLCQEINGKQFDEKILSHILDYCAQLQAL